ncbi:MAG TPA: efflux RND transporter periplasmic adaptor subunit [Xanthomonadaceae bacterium]|jgi:cobalt-zinc-cadmium efflux system membrane fusion protein
MNTDPILRTPTGERRRAPRSTRTALAGFACALTLGLASCSHSSGDAPADASATPANVQLTAEQKQHIGIRTIAASRFGTTVEATGAVDFDNDHATSVVAPFSGPVARILVQPGQKVRKGDALAIVDSSDFSAAIDTYAKALVAAKNLRRIADADKDLVQHKGVSDRENEQAQTDAAGADADRDAALQSLVSLGVDPATIAEVQSGKRSARAQGVIRAPIAGTVAEKLISPGTLLQAGSTACFTLADLSRVWVMAQVSASDLKSVAVGDPVDVLTDTDAKGLKGSVDNISAVVDPDTRAVIARVAVDNPGDALKKQMYVRVRIHSQDEHEGIQAPASAILRDDENLPFVYVVASDGSFARQQVTLGDRIGDQYAIPEGLKAGDRIVVDGGLFMQFMQAQ